MYNIQLSTIAGKQFYVNDKNVVYTCIGYGDAQPESSRLLIVGMRVDNNETVVRTFRDNEVHFTS